MVVLMTYLVLLSNYCWSLNGIILSGIQHVCLIRLTHKTMYMYTIHNDKHTLLASLTEQSSYFIVSIKDRESTAYLNFTLADMYNVDILS